MYSNLCEFAAILIRAEYGYGLGITPNTTVEWWVFIYYLCKLLDWGDTLFIVLGKKNRQLSLLHLYHHASIVPLFSYYLSSGLGGTYVAGLPLLNSLVHVAMYSHYLITSLVTFKHMWWKPIVTALQIGHHVILAVLMCGTGIYGNPYWTPWIAAGGCLWGMPILGLFLKFYLESYWSNGKKGKNGKNGKNGHHEERTNGMNGKHHDHMTNGSTNGKHEHMTNGTNGKHEHTTNGSNGKCD